jgi:hypothetical protein
VVALLILQEFYLTRRFVQLFIQMIVKQFNRQQLQLIIVFKLKKQIILQAVQVVQVVIVIVQMTTQLKVGLMIK